MENITEREKLAQDTIMKLLAAWGLGYPIQQAAPLIREAVENKLLWIGEDGVTVKPFYNRPTTKAERR